MSMMRLLSAGRSLVGLEDNGKQYRMSHPGALPKFGSGKNPFLEIKAMIPAEANAAGKPTSKRDFPNPAKKEIGRASCRERV